MSQFNIILIQYKIYIRHLGSHNYKIQFSLTAAHEDAEVRNVLQINDSLTSNSNYDAW